jgi:hypothetical protein
MTTANVRYISNGYIVDWQGSVTIGVPASLFAGAIPEVVYWLGRIFDPVANPAAMRRQVSAQDDVAERIQFYTQWQNLLRDQPSVAPQIIEPADDPLLGQRASVIDVASGGFLVTQVPNVAIAPGAQFVEVYCANMDAVSDALMQIYTPPPPEAARADSAMRGPDRLF